GIGIRDNFFELGGHSLKAIQMINAIRKEFNYKLLVSVLYENQTIEQLSNAIIVVDNTNILVKINAKGNKKPFFFTPTIIGDVFSYHRLSELLGKSQPFYGFQSPNLYLSKEQASYSIPEIAKKIISEMQKIAPKGPYTLGGYSYGGLIVYEICVQLQNQGIKLDEVFLIDCKPPQNEKAITNFEIKDSVISFCNMINFMNDSRGRVDLKIDIHDLEKETFDNQLSCLHKKLMDLGFLFSREMLESYMYEYMRSIQNMIEYIPAQIKIDANIKLIKSYSDGNEIDNYGWESFSLENKLTSIEVDCNHLELLNQNNILKYIHILKK
ncbi:thioesterase domain-containing protein, partial [Chryseobacterium gambrini]|uniref:thioesterase domain-containing protein n=1 Tax=Chryseobacterium gambrini TaxID=373672 RepID=UPI003BA64AA9